MARFASNKILRNTSIWSIFYVARLCLGLDLKYSCALWVQYWIRVMRPKMTYYLMISYWLRLDLMFCTYFICYLSWSGFVWNLELQQSSESIFADLYASPFQPKSVYTQVMFFQATYKKEKLLFQIWLIYLIKFYCFTVIYQWSLLRSECKTICIWRLAFDWLIV